MTLPSLPTTAETDVRPEWVDYNGHMNLAYYMLIFDQGTDGFLDLVGITAITREASGNSVFVAEAHITYDREVMERERVCVKSQIVGYDEKRLHLFHYMYGAKNHILSATNELMILHVNLKSRRVCPFDSDVIARIRALSDDHAAFGTPEAAGRVIAIPGSR